MSVKNSDSARARELYKYYQPVTTPESSKNDVPRKPTIPTLTATQVSSPDTALTAYAQLVAHRLNCQRAMISLIDSQTQYFVAEATRTLDLLDNSRHDDGDALWVGCTSVSKHGRLCEVTLETVPKAPVKYACFIVSDLTKDERFNQLPFVTGPPFFKFYAGTPIQTSNGVNIGSVFVIDSEIRPGLRDSEIDFLGTMAHTIMGHLQFTREATLRIREKKMMDGLLHFVESMSSVSPSSAENIPEDESYPTRVENKDATKSEPARSGDAGETSSHPSLAPSVPANATKPSLPHTESQESAISTSSSRGSGQPRGRHTSSFNRAARILRDSIGIDGVLFFDTSIGFDDSSDQQRTDAKASRLGASRTFTSSTFDAIASKARNKVVTNAAVLGSTSPASLTFRGRAYHDNIPQGTIDENALQYMVQLYPLGKLWTIDEGRIVPSSEDDETGRPEVINRYHRYDHGQSSQVPVRREDFEEFLLQSIFPEACQVLYSTLYDSSTQLPLAGCFAWNDNPTLVLTKEIDLAFMKTFLINLAAEIGRREVFDANRQKSQFIGSISHELRSPLHGILGSVELLKDTAIDVQQASLIEGMEASGHSLLDVINSLLDYSKINAFSPNSMPSRKQKQHIDSPRTASEMLSATIRPDVSMSALATVVNLAILCEEVTDGALTGFMFSDFSADVRGIAQSARVAEGGLMTVVLDIESGKNWEFIAEPGAMRRILLNIIGNALKYTPPGGWVKVGLRSRDADSHQEPDDRLSIIEFIVTDNGRGISDHFLKQNFFTAFAQESSISSGLGLGMSIVQSIVNAYNGQIDVKSQLGTGTEIKISLPLDRAAEHSPETSASATLHNSSAAFEILLQRLKALRCDKVATYGFDQISDIRSCSSMIHDSLVAYLTGWFEMNVMTCDLASLMSQNDKVIFVNGQELSAYLTWEAECMPEQRPHLITVSGKDAIRHVSIDAGPHLGRNIVMTSPPLGPMKIARALLHALDPTRDIRRLSKTAPDPLLNSSGPLDKAIKTAVQEVQGTIPYFKPHSREDMPTQTALPDRNLPLLVPGHSTGLPFSPVPTSTPPFLLLPSDVNAAPPRGAENTPEMSRPRILLVDDNPINLKLLDMFMRKAKCHQIDHAQHGHDAVEMFKRGYAMGERYEIIFMDLSMPVLDGFGATRAIRKFEQIQLLNVEGREAPMPSRIIAFTGLASFQDQRAAFDCGVDQYMIKPVKSAEVRDIIDVWVIRQATNARK